MKRRLHLRSNPLLLSPLPSRSTEGLSEAKTHTHTYTHLSLGHCCVFRPGLCQTSGLMQWRGDALHPPIPHGLQKAKLRSAAASQAALRAELGETRLLRCGMRPPPPSLPSPGSAAVSPCPPEVEAISPVWDSRRQTFLFLRDLLVTC